MVAPQELEPELEPESATGSEAEGSEESGDGNGDDLQILKGKFVVASENGFIVNDLPGSGGTSSWRCTAPGSLASLRW